MQNKLHPLIIRQLKRSGIDISQIPDPVVKFIFAVDSAYKESDKDRELLERSLELSSKEIYSQNEEVRVIINSLKTIFSDSELRDKNLSFSQILIKNIDSLKNSKDSLTKQAALLREQSIELVQARDEALESSRFKSAFLANMSHEIRTPMNGTLGMLKILQTTELKEEQREYINLAIQSSLSLLSIIEDILDFSKIEAGKLDIENIEFKPRHTLKSVLTTVYNQANAKGVELLAYIDPNLPLRLIGDSNRLKQVLINLISNGIKFTNKGYVLLEVKYLGKDSDDKDLIAFSVEDTGIGIKKDKIEKIFDAFQQADTNTNRVFGGTGLGLSISQQLIGLLGSQINVISEINKGSRFSFELKFDSSIMTDKSFNKWENNFNNKNIIVVSNSKILSQTISSYFSTLSNNKILPIIKTYAEAVQHQQPSILFYDISSKLNLESTNEIRNLVLAKHKVIVVNSIFNLSEKDKIFNLGSKSVLFKPFIDTDLILSFNQSINATCELEWNKKDIIKPVINTQSLRIVVVDDIHVNRLVAQKLLEQKKHDIVCFESGNELLEHLRNNKSFEWKNFKKSSECDLILLDIQMPGLDGVETCKLIRKWENEKGREDQNYTPIIALTAHALKEDRERFIEAGMDDYLRKPIDTDALSLILSKYSLKDSKNYIDSKFETKITVNDNLLLIRFGNDKEVVKEIIEAFLEEEEELCHNLENAIKCLDNERIRKAAHAIKGSLLNICGDEAAKVAEEIEGSAKSNSIEINYEELNSELREQIMILKESLTQLI